MDRTERKSALTREAERITRFLVDRGATLVVAFGSFARDQVGSVSDLDIIAVMESDLPFIKRLDRLYGELVPSVGLDLLVYTPEEWEQMRHRSFIRQALAEGQVLHAA
jgi:predicted nucleotidyltransferase